jgi:hypothetical protein
MGAMMYDLCLLHRDGRVIGVGTIMAPDDDDACEQARRLADLHPVVELWRQSRRVVRLTATAKPS